LPASPKLGRRLSLPLGVSPAFSELAPSSASPPSSSPSTESARGHRGSRHGRRFPRRFRPTPPQIPHRRPLLRSSRPRRHAQGETPVHQDPSALFPPRPSAAPARPAGELCGRWARAAQDEADVALGVARPAWLLMWWLCPTCQPQWLANPLV
jgi:hypothetical protein